MNLLDGLDHVALEVLQALVPLIVFFIIFQIAYLKLPKEYVLNMAKGVGMTFAGIVLFLHGVSIAFIPAGRQIGEFFGALPNQWVFIPFGFMMGFLATYAEPAVRVLCYQVEKSTSGYIRGRVVLNVLSIGVAVSVALGVAKVVYGIPFQYIIIPGYVAALVLMYLTDKDFVAIAFDSGAVATGPMAVTFLMFMAVGAAAVIEGRNVLVDGFGLIALIALAPILGVLILGVVLKVKGGEKDEV